MRIRYIVVAALLACVTVFSAAQERSWRIADFGATVQVAEDGSADITEKLTMVFIGEYHGIRRWIPIDYPGPNGANYSLFLNVEHVTDENGNKLKYEAKTQQGFRVLKIYVNGATDTSKKVLISYHVTNASKFFDDYDEFYWNVTGNGWAVPIDSASVVVNLPQSAAGKLQARRSLADMAQGRRHRRASAAARCSPRRRTRSPRTKGSPLRCG
jgi:hypothetical protein